MRRAVRGDGRGAVRRWLQLAAVLTLSLCGYSQTAPHPQLYTFRHPAMGTEFTVYLYASDEPKATAAANDVFDEVDRIEQELSNYRPSSELSRINQQAHAAPVTTDPETFRFLQAAQHWSETSDGAFDITVGPLMKLWGFFDHQGRIPSEQELQATRQTVGYQHVELDPATRSVRLSAAGMELDPGGIGKGFAVDAAVLILRSHHIAAALISAGSSTLYALGHPPAQTGWRVVVPGLGADSAGISAVRLRDTSLSSANCNEKHFTVDGHLYCHIMDPRTLRPVEGRLHVSIIHPSATTSDALSNVLFVDTPSQSQSFLRHYAPQARAIIVSGTPAAPHCSTYRWPSTIDTSRCPTANPANLVKPPNPKIISNPNKTNQINFLENELFTMRNSVKSNWR
jgi:thiamine biosynthesis lipoprotein